MMNVKQFVNGKKDIDIFKLKSMSSFTNSSKYSAECAKKFNNHIQNGYYDIRDLAKFFLYEYMMTNKKNISLIKYTEKDVLEVCKLFTKKRIDQDLKLLKSVHTQLSFKKIEDYFDMKEDGTNIAYILTIQGKISPIFFIRNIEKVLTNGRKDDIIYNKEFEQFVKIAKKIKDTFNGGITKCQ